MNMNRYSRSEIPSPLYDHRYGEALNNLSPYDEAEVPTTFLSPAYGSPTEATYGIPPTLPGQKSTVRAQEGRTSPSFAPNHTLSSFITPSPYGRPSQIHYAGNHSRSAHNVAPNDGAFEAAWRSRPGEGYPESPPPFVPSTPNPGGYPSREYQHKHSIPTQSPLLSRPIISSPVFTTTQPFDLGSPKITIPSPLCTKPLEKSMSVIDHFNSRFERQSRPSSPDLRQNYGKDISEEQKSNHEKEVAPNDSRAQYQKEDNSGVKRKRVFEEDEDARRIERTRYGGPTGGHLEPDDTGNAAIQTGTNPGSSVATCSEEEMDGDEEIPPPKASDYEVVDFILLCKICNKKVKGSKVDQHNSSVLHKHLAKAKKYQKITSMVGSTSNGRTLDLPRMNPPLSPPHSSDARHAPSPPLKKRKKNSLPAARNIIVFEDSEAPISSTDSSQTSFHSFPSIEPDSSFDQENVRSAAVHHPTPVAGGNTSDNNDEPDSSETVGRETLSDITHDLNTTLRRGRKGGARRRRRGVVDPTAPRMGQSTQTPAATISGGISSRYPARVHRRPQVVVQDSQETINEDEEDVDMSFDGGSYVTQTARRQSPRLSTRRRRQDRPTVLGSRRQ